MRKKIICIFLTLILCLGVLGLTACNFNTIPINRNPQNETEEQDTNLTPDTTPEEDTSSSTKSLSVKGKTFIFDITAVQYVSMIYPKIEQVASNNADSAFATETEEESTPQTSEEIILTIQMMQEYINDIYATYSGSTLAFLDGNKVVQTFADGTINNYDYQQVFYNITIGDMTDSGSMISGQVDTDLMILQMYLSNYAIVYLQFVVVQ